VGCVILFFTAGGTTSWQFKAETVIDSTFYGGQYYQIDDSTRIIATPRPLDCLGAGKYTVQMLKDNKWVNTSAFTYHETHDTRADMLNFLKRDYDRFMERKKMKAEKDEIWKYEGKIK